MSCVVACIALGVVMVVSVLRGVPTRPYIFWGDRVTWKILAEYSWNPTITRSGSFLVLQLVLRLLG